MCVPSSVATGLNCPCCINHLPPHAATVFELPLAALNSVAGMAEPHAGCEFWAKGERDGGPKPSEVHSLGEQNAWMQAGVTFYRRQTHITLVPACQVKSGCGLARPLPASCARVQPGRIRLTFGEELLKAGTQGEIEAAGKLDQV